LPIFSWFCLTLEQILNMKTSLSLSIFSCLLWATINVSNAQNVASASVVATIVVPISIEKTAAGDLSFGNVAAGNAAGIIILTATGQRLAEGGVNLPSSVGNISAAEFLITGEGSSSFSISLPVSPVMLTNTEGANETMTVDSFTSFPASSGTLTDGKQIIRVGASLNIKAMQATGLYKSSEPFQITVNYN
jgi:hypothetical protein